MLTNTLVKRDLDYREKILVQLIPSSLRELYIKVKDFNVETRQLGHRGE